MPQEEARHLRAPPPPWSGKPTRDFSRARSRNTSAPPSTERPDLVGEERAERREELTFRSDAGALERPPRHDHHPPPPCRPHGRRRRRAPADATSRRSRRRISARGRRLHYQSPPPEQRSGESPPPPSPEATRACPSASSGSGEGWRGRGRVGGGGNPRVALGSPSRGRRESDTFFLPSA